MAGSSAHGRSHWPGHTHTVDLFQLIGPGNWADAKMRGSAGLSWPFLCVGFWIASQHTRGLWTARTTNTAGYLFAITLAAGSHISSTSATLHAHTALQKIYSSETAHTHTKIFRVGRTSGLHPELHRCSPVWAARCCGRTPSAVYCEAGGEGVEVEGLWQHRVEALQDVRLNLGCGAVACSAGQVHRDSHDDPRHGTCAG